MAVNSRQNRFAAAAKLYGSTPEEEINLLEELKREVELNFDIVDCGKIVDEFRCVSIKIHFCCVVLAAELEHSK